MQACADWGLAEEHYRDCTIVRYVFSADRLGRCGLFRYGAALGLRPDLEIASRTK
jgi:hypothetical protein